MVTVEQLADSTENALAFLCEQGLHQSGRRILFPESFKGGFVLTYAGNGQELTVAYLDQQLEVCAAEAEIFGPKLHPEFAGNMFSREHLLQYLPKLAQVLRAQLFGSAQIAG